MLTVKHKKTNNIASWTQADLDAQIALGFYPPGTLITDITLSSDWNDTHTISGSLFTSVPEAGNFNVAHADAFSRFEVSANATATLQTDIADGDEFIFILRANATLTIQTASGGIIAISPTTISSTNGTISASKKYSLIHLIAFSNTEMQAQSTVGTWFAS